MWITNLIIFVLWLSVSDEQVRVKKLLAIPPLHSSWLHDTVVHWVDSCIAIRVWRFFYFYSLEDILNNRAQCNARVRPSVSGRLGQPGWPVLRWCSLPLGLLPAVQRSGNGPHRNKTNPIIIVDLFVVACLPYPVATDCYSYRSTSLLTIHYNNK